MVIFPNVKINIGLSITGKRPDGYHNIESVMYPVKWRESLEVIERSSGDPLSFGANAFAENGKVRMFLYGIEIPGRVEDNLCIKVFHLLEQWFNLPQTDIHLLKTNPIGAGLGGGSADAAFCMRALKDFYGLRISDAEAEELLSKVGSDCAFFWKNKPVFAFGRGDQMRQINLDLANYWVVLIYPDISISTKEAYAGVTPKPPLFDLNLLGSIPVDTWPEVVKNDFETSLFPKYPVLAGIKEDMYNSGAIYASMSGSGSTIYGIFSEKPTLTRPSENSILYTCKL